MKGIDLVSMAGFDGSSGKLACAAFQGKVVEVPRSGVWKEGSRHKRHYAGEDLTEEMERAPHTDGMSPSATPRCSSFIHLRVAERTRRCGTRSKALPILLP
jgi:predicted heme/steroid binding protein